MLKLALLLRAYGGDLILPIEADLISFSVFLFIGRWLSVYCPLETTAGENSTSVRLRTVATRHAIFPRLEPLDNIQIQGGRRVGAYLRTDPRI